MKVRSTVRHREDTGWELQCPACRQYLPLDDEFWEPRRGMSKCRYCWRSQDRAAKRARYHSSPEYAEARRRKAREYRLAGRDAEKIRARMRWESLKSDPLLLAQHREKNRLAMQRLRERRRAA